MLIAAILALWAVWARRPQSTLLPNLLSTAIGLLGTLVLFEVLFVRHSRLQLRRLAKNALYEPMHYLLMVITWTAQCYAETDRRGTDFKELLQAWTKAGKDIDEAMRYLHIGADADLANKLRVVRKFVNEFREGEASEFIADETCRVQEMSLLVMSLEELDKRLFGRLMKSNLDPAKALLDKLESGDLETTNGRRTVAKTVAKPLRGR